MADRTPRKKRPAPASARVTNSSKKSGKFTAFAYACAEAAPRRALNFVDDGSASDDDDAFVPAATHKLLGYKCRGESALAPHVEAIFDLAHRVCAVPRDFQAQHKYGSKSGICHEERLANAYLHGMLGPKHGRRLGPGGPQVDDGEEDELRRQLKRLVDRKEFDAAVELCTDNEVEV
jgi:hypothetical protein